MRIEERVGLIGGGNMAEALVRCWLERGLLAAAQVAVGEPSAERRRHWRQRYGVAAWPGNRTALAGAAVAVLAVKPQVMGTVLEELAGAGHSGLWISIAAGIPIRTLAGRLGAGGRFVRVMPNTPAMAGAGMSALCAGGGATPADLATARALFAAVGQVVEVTEEQMDAVTAVSGSGPAYFFHLAEALEQAGMDLGLGAELAGALARATLTGAAALLAMEKADPAELRRRVTSPGGTTAAALAVLGEKEWVEIFRRAVRAAAERSRQLSAAAAGKD